MLAFDELITQLSVIKKLGYKKNRNTWFKRKDDLTLVFSVQKSHYDSDFWYYCFGVCLHAIGDANARSINKCQITYRVDRVSNGVSISADMIYNLIIRWEEMYGELNKLRACAIQGKLPSQVTQSAVRYLSTVDLSKFM